MFGSAAAPKPKYERYPYEVLDELELSSNTQRHFIYQALRDPKRKTLYVDYQACLVGENNEFERISGLNVQVQTWFNLLKAANVVAARVKCILRTPEVAALYGIQAPGGSVSTSSSGVPRSKTNRM